MKLTTTLVLSGKTSTGLRIPDEIVDELGGGRRPAVTVTLNGTYTYRSSIANMGGEFWLGVSAEHRQGAGVAANDEVEVELALDTEPRVVDVPADLAEALAADPVAGPFFQTLSYSNKRRHVLAIEGAKTAETRQRRIDKALAQFREGRA